MLPSLCISGYAKKRARSAHKSDVLFPCAPPSSGKWSGAFGEDCLSAQREFRSRLTV